MNGKNSFTTTSGGAGFTFNNPYRAGGPFRPPIPSTQTNFGTRAAAGGAGFTFPGGPFRLRLPNAAANNVSSNVGSQSRAADGLQAGLTFNFAPTNYRTENQSTGTTGPTAGSVTFNFGGPGVSWRVPTDVASTNNVSSNVGSQSQAVGHPTRNNFGGFNFSTLPSQGFFTFSGASTSETQSHIKTAGFTGFTFGAPGNAAFDFNSRAAQFSGNTGSASFTFGPPRNAAFDFTSRAAQFSGNTGSANSSFGVQSIHATGYKPVQNRKRARPSSSENTGFANLNNSQNCGENRLPSAVNLPQCIICWDKERDIVFLPCSHLIICSSCANHKVTTCPLCRKYIAQKIKTYIS